jgi:aminoglycoside 3-N-acetyltransferase I
MMNIPRLTSGDRDWARTLFTVIATVFEGEHGELNDEYLDRLLRREDFWALAAFADGSIVGGLTAHTLPMTRTATSEIFIYDLAMQPEH